MQIYIHTNNANICMQEISGVLDNDVCRAVHVRYSPEVPSLFFAFEDLTKM